MDLFRINFYPIAEGGDDVTRALRKVDLNFGSLGEAFSTDGEVGGRLASIEGTIRALGTAAGKNVGTAAGTVAAGDDARFLPVGTSSGTVAAGDDPRFKSVGTVAGTVAAGDDLRFAANADASAAAMGVANKALPRSGGEMTGPISAKLGGVVAYGTTGSANIGGIVYSDYLQNTIVDINGNVFIRLQCMDVNGGATSARLLTSHFDGTNASFMFQHNGVAQATTWQSTSDERLKRKMVVLTNPLEKIESIVGYESYEKRVLGNTVDDAGESIRAQYTVTCGVLAQDVQKVLPAAVDNLGAGFDTEDRPIDDVLGVNDAGLSALFVECLKALKAQNASLMERVDLLERRSSP